MKIEVNNHFELKALLKLKKTHLLWVRIHKNGLVNKIHHYEQREFLALNSTPLIPT